MKESAAGGLTALR